MMDGAVLPDVPDDLVVRDDLVCLALQVDWGSLVVPVLSVP